MAPMVPAVKIFIKSRLFMVFKSDANACDRLAILVLATPIPEAECCNQLPSILAGKQYLRHAMVTNPTNPTISAFRQGGVSFQFDVTCPGGVQNGHT